MAMADRFADHRRQLAEAIGTDGIAVVPAAVEVVRNDDVHAILLRQKISATK